MDYHDLLKGGLRQSGRSVGTPLHEQSQVSCKESTLAPPEIQRNCARTPRHTCSELASWIQGRLHSDDLSSCKTWCLFFRTSSAVQSEESADQCRLYALAFQLPLTISPAAIGPVFCRPSSLNRVRLWSFHSKGGHHEDDPNTQRSHCGGRLDRLHRTTVQCAALQWRNSA